MYVQLSWLWHTWGFQRGGGEDGWYHQVRWNPNSGHKVLRASARAGGDVFFFFFFPHLSGELHRRVSQLHKSFPGTRSPHYQWSRASPPSSRLTTLPASALVSFSNPQRVPSASSSSPRPPPHPSRHTLLLPSPTFCSAAAPPGLVLVSRSCQEMCRRRAPWGPALLFNARIQISPLSCVPICKFLGVSRVCVYVW